MGTKTGRLQQFGPFSILGSAMRECESKLKRWTDKGKAHVVYDITVDEFTDQGLFNTLTMKPNVAIIGFT